MKSSMKIICLLSILIASFKIDCVASITIEVDPRVELIGIVFHLAGSPEYSNGRIESYMEDTEKHFGEFDKHPVVRLARELRKTRLMSNDGPMSLCVHINQDFEAKKSFDSWPWGLDHRWKKQETRKFIKKLQHFAKESKFNEFFNAHITLYDEGIRSCESLLAESDLLEWMDGFFYLEEGLELKLVLGFLNGPNNYGKSFNEGSNREIYSIIGINFVDHESGKPAFQLKQLGLVAHEFCHSLVKPVVDKNMDQLRPAGEILYETHALAMQRIGYQNWQTLMYESAVRACVASFVRYSYPPEVLGYYLNDENRYGFIWTKALGEELINYENNRDKYPTFDSFFIQFINFFKDYVKEVEV